MREGEQQRERGTIKLRLHRLACWLARGKPWKRLDPSHPLLWTQWLPQAVLLGLGKRQEQCRGLGEVRQGSKEEVRLLDLIYVYTHTATAEVKTNEACGEKRLSPNVLLRTTRCAYGSCKQGGPDSARFLTSQFLGLFFSEPGPAAFARRHKIA